MVVIVAMLAVVGLVLPYPAAATVVVHEERTVMIIIMVRSVLNVNNKKQHLVTLVHLQ